jgi:hypothetical protein
MIGAFTVGKKAIQFGYKRYGIPGAVASGGVALAGYVLVRRALRSATEGEDVEAAIDASTIESAVDDGGLDAVSDSKVLDDAIDDDELDEDVETEEVQSSIEDETDDLEDEAADGDA